MDVVGTFNHLIPSDQLEESLLLGQNLESEASDEFGTGHHLLEDSLKNMLSDKDPMLGSASTQFHLLDNEDASYEAAGSTGLGGISESRGACGVSRGSMARSRGQRGRARKTSALSSRKPSCAADQEPGKSGFTQGRSSESLSKLAGSKVAGRCDRSGLNNQQESAEAQEDPVATAQDKEEGAAQSTVCSKVGPSMNPVVVLRRLTVTVGGYKIELLPGPSKVPPTPGSSAAPSLGFLDTEEGVEGVAFSVNAPDGQVVEHVTATQDLEKYCAAEAPAELGPYVNPNEVQESSDVLLSGSPPTVDVCTADTEARNQLDSQQPDLGSVKGTPSINSGGGETRQRVQANKSASLSMSVGKEGQDQKTSTHKQLKSKLSPGPPDKKNLVPNTSKRAGGVPKTPLLKNVARGNVQSIQPPKGKPAAMAAKRRTEHLQTYPPSKMLRGQDKRWSKQDVRPKSPSPFHPVIKRLLPGTGGPDGTQKQHLGTQAGNSKASRLPFGPKPSHPQAAVARPGHLPREPSEDDDPEKCRTKKPERGFQRHRSRSVRSLSVDEPPLFIPDNAPLVKKEATEEDTAAGEATWDPSKHCGFCRKPHSNRFMVGCGRCDDWFHGECVGLDLAKAQQMEREDQEYVCLKCCAEEDQKVESEDHGAASAERQVKVEQSQENKPVVKHEKLGLPSSVGGVRKDSVDRRSLEDRAAESRASSGSDQRLHVPRRLKVSGDTAHRLGAHERLETKKSRSSSATSKKPSVEQIRRNVRDSLKDILMKRLSESDLKVSAERAANVATKTEKELFAFFRDTDSKYKSKYRSLMFNLKDAKNSVLFKRVLKGEISPHHLIRMTPEELASKELAAWRQRENRHAIEMIEKEQREVDRRPITKITHKGEIEIENQEPENEPEAPDTEPEPAPKPPEEPETAPPEPEPESTKDTTAQHKTHLFDLNCKICTGRMPPPVEDATTKVVKVATTVMRRQTSMDGEGQTCASPQAEEESLVSSRVLSSIDERLSCTSGREDETSFLDRLELLWKGFVNMPSVAKFVTKAYPVSGALDHLTEDLPDSIQVGGRISPQTVWDYMEKIRASGTKELCLIRFAPVTEEDEISYTLLYAYFSSRRRYGVVANNMKHVKDMYLIPLGGSEKIPHQLVPFDGPGLETNRPNLLLGLIIRQRLKRDFGVLMSVDMPEASAARFLSENRSKLDSGSEAGSTLTGEDYLNSLKVARTTETANPQPSAMEGTDVGEAPLTTEGSLQEAAKPLRFLPGVLVGRGGRSSPCADPASRTLVAVPQGLLGTSEKEVNRQAPPGDSVAKGNGHGRSPASNGLRLDRFVIKKKDSKCSHPELQQKTASVDDPFSKELGGDPSMTAVETAPKAGSPAHSTEGVFPKLPSWAGRGLDKAPSSSKADCLGEQAKHEGLALQAVTVSDSGSVASEAISSSSAAGPVQPATGILKTSSTVYQAERQDSRPPAEEGVAEQKAIRPNAQPISQERPLASVPTVDTQPSPHQPVGDAQPISTILSGSKAEDRTLRVPLLPTPPASVFGHGGQGLPAAMFPPVQATEFQYQQVPTQTFQSQGNAAPLFQPLDQQGGFAYRGALPPFPQPNHSHSQPASPWLGATPPAAAFHPSQHGPSGPALSTDPLRCPESSRPSATTKEDKASEQRYGDSWERQPRQADESYGRDGAEQHGRPRHCGDPHHERKGGPRDRDREHGKPREPQPEDGGSWERNRSRSRSRSRDGSSRERHRRHDEKHRDGRSRHRNHSGGEHSRGDRHHKQHRERDRDKHRRDSYDKGSRASKDASKDGRS